MARQDVGDLHHLFLVDDHAVSLFEQRLQLGQVVGDSLAAMLAIDEVVYHAALKGAGAIERVERGEILDTRRMVAAQNVAHAGRFKLEDAAGEGLRKDFVGGRVVERQLLGHQADAVTLLDQFQRVVDERERGQAQEVHLEKLQLLEAVHVELRDNFFPIGAVERNEFLQRLRRDDHAGGVHGTVARHAFQPKRDLQDLGHARIFALQLAEARLGFHGVVERDVQDVGHQLGEALHVREAHVQHAAHIFDGGARGHGVEGDDLRHLLAAVFLSDVLDDFAAPVHAEIDIDIGQADALGIQEALEQQAVLQRIDIGDAHGVAHQAACRRAAARADRNGFRSRKADEIPDDQEVARELHLLDHLDFAVEALGVFRQVVLQAAGGAQSLQPYPASFETLARDEFEISIGGVLGRDFEFRERLLDFLQVDVAALGDFPSAVERLFQLAEQLHHLGARFQIEIRRVPFHARWVAHGFAGLDAEQDFVRAGVVAAQIVRVVGDHQRRAGFRRQPVDRRYQALVLFEVVVLDFEEEIAFAEDVRIGVCGAAGFVVAVGQQDFGNVAAQAGGHADQPFGVPREQVLVDAGLVIEAFQEARGNQVDEVAIAFLGLAEQDQVIVAVGVAAGFVALLRNVDLAADDRAHAFALGGVVELDGAEQVAVVGHGDGGHLLLDDRIHELADFTSSIEEGVIGVAVQMDERVFRHGLPLINRQSGLWGGDSILARRRRGSGGSGPTLPRLRCGSLTARTEGIAATDRKSTRLNSSHAK